MELNGSKKEVLNIFSNRFIYFLYLDSIVSILRLYYLNTKLKPSRHLQQRLP